MSKNKKPYPKAKTPYDILDDEHYANAASSMECTGLIMQPAQNEDELESYADIYDFGPGAITKCP